MPDNQNTEQTSLRSGAPIRLNNALDNRIHCLEGTLWITMAGEAADIFLEAGDSCRITHQGLCLIESMSDGCVRIEKAERTPKPKKYLVDLLTRWRAAPSVALETSRTGPAA